MKKSHVTFFLLFSFGLAFLPHPPCSSLSHLYLTISHFLSLFLSISSLPPFKLKEGGKIRKPQLSAEPQKPDKATTANILQGLFLLTLTSYSTAPLDSLQITQALSLDNSVLLPDAKSSTIHVTSLHLTSQLYHVQEHHARVSRLAATFGSNGLVLGLRLLKNFMRDTI